MSINYSNSIKNARLKILADEMSNGKINIYTNGYETLLVSIDLSEKPTSISEGTLTFLNIPLENTAIENGVSALAIITNKEGEILAQGLTVGVSFTDLIIDSTDIKIGQKVIIVSGIIVHG